MSANAVPNDAPEAGLGGLIPQLITLISAFFTSEDKTDLTREAVDLASKFFAVDLDTSSYGYTTNYFNLLAGSGMWSLSFLTIPVVVTAIIWYFIVTFLLQRNVLGRSFGSSVGGESRDQVLEDLTAKVTDAVEHTR